MWLLQEMLEQYTREDNDYLRFRHALDISNTEYTVVSYKNAELSVLDEDFVPKIDSEKLILDLISSPFLIKGSVLLEKQFKHSKRNILKEELEITFENLFDFIPKEYILNVPYQIDYLKNLNSLDNKVMLRPIRDNKVITGGLFTSEELTVLKQTYTTFNNAEEFTKEKLMLSKLQDVVNEYRFFIIDGKISTYSTYMYNYVYNTEQRVPKHVIDFAEYLNVRYPIVTNTVLDICELGTGELKLIEFNNLACSGLYNCDEHKIVADLNKLITKFKVR